MVLQGSWLKNVTGSFAPGKLLHVWFLYSQDQKLFPFSASSRIIVYILPASPRGFCRCKSSISTYSIGWVVVTDSTIRHLAPKNSKHATVWMDLNRNIPLLLFCAKTPHWTLNLSLLWCISGRKLTLFVPFVWADIQMLSKWWTDVCSQGIWMAASVNFLLPDTSLPVFPHLQSGVEFVSLSLLDFEFVSLKPALHLPSTVCACWFLSPS